MLNPFCAVYNCQDDPVTKKYERCYIDASCDGGYKSSTMSRTFFSSSLAKDHNISSTSFDMQFATKLLATVVAVASAVSALPNVDTPVSVVAVRLISDD